MRHQRGDRRTLGPAGRPAATSSRTCHRACPLLEPGHLTVIVNACRGDSGDEKVRRSRTRSNLWLLPPPCPHAAAALLAALATCHQRCPAVHQSFTVTKRASGVLIHPSACMWQAPAGSTHAGQVSSNPCCRTLSRGLRRALACCCRPPAGLHKPRPHHAAPRAHGCGAAAAVGAAAGCAAGAAAAAAAAGLAGTSIDSYCFRCCAASGLS